MKRLVFTLGLCLVATVCFGQKKAVATASRLAKDAAPKFAEARTSINEALQHPETKDDAKTWYVAGLIESLQFDSENVKIIMGQPQNDVLMYDALYAIYPYFLKAYELDMLPDAKGKVKPKYVKDMRSILKVNIQNRYYVNGGAYYIEQQQPPNYKKAFELFDQFLEIADSRLIKEGMAKNETQLVNDTLYAQISYYAAICTEEGMDDATAMRAINRALKYDEFKNELYQLLVKRYLDAQDTVNYEKTLDEAVALFPNDLSFVTHLLKLYIDTERNEKALNYINIALKLDPSNAQYCHVAGSIYETGFKDLDKAEEYFKKAIEIDGEDAELQASVGRVYFNRAVLRLDVANELNDIKKYSEERDKAKDLFRQAMPYYEKAFRLNPDLPEPKMALRNIYYNLEIGDKLEEIEKYFKGE